MTVQYIARCLASADSYVLKSLIKTLHMLHTTSR